MAVSGTLYTYPKNFRAYKALIAAKYSGATVKVAEDFQFGVTNKSDAYLAKFPCGSVPAFEAKTGECLMEGNAIAFAVANETLRGKTTMEQAQIVQWMSIADTCVLPSVTKWVFPVLGLMPFNKNTNEEAVQGVKSFMQCLDGYLSTRTYLVGESITLADIVLACTLLRLFENVWDKSCRDGAVHATRWFDTIVHQKEVVAVIGEFEYCATAKVFNASVFKEMQAALGTGVGAQKKDSKKEEKKQAAKPKQEKPAVKEEEPKPAPKPKDPLDALPAGNFNMDDFKRFYSNNDEDKSVPYFWEKFDSENYSIWMGTYLFNDELSKVFMTCNLVGGMFQRLEKLRKNAFASVCVFGEDGNNSISGVWVWRGHELAFPLSDDWQIDYESYEWKKLDANTDETKNIVNRYFKWEGEDADGRKFNQGKIFK